MARVTPRIHRPTGTTSVSKSKTTIIEESFQYEIHITVENRDLETFKLDCAKINVEPLLIQKYNGEDYQNDMETSETLPYVTFSQAIARRIETENSLKTMGYNVTRSKIETPPSNYEKVPQHHYYDNNSYITNYPHFEYFEVHIKPEIPKKVNSILDYVEIKGGENNLYTNHSLHISLNITNPNDVRLLFTYRLGKEYGYSPRDIDYDANALTRSLKNYGFRIKEHITEACIFDNNKELDDIWINRTKTALLSVTPILPEQTGTS
jgi:hypothetical protein